MIFSKTFFPNLTEAQEAILVNSFEELVPYLYKCYPLLCGCLKPNMSCNTHMYIVFEFDIESQLDPSTLSSEVKERWSFTNEILQHVQDLNTVQKNANKKQFEFWVNNGQLFTGAPPIQKKIPLELLQQMFSENENNYVHSCCYN